MDARERLRRYLEQRREIGESELVLDGMPVEDVMRMLDARTATPRPRAAARDTPRDTEREVPGDSPDAAQAPKAPGSPDEVVRTETREHAASEPASTPEPSPAAPPPVPEVRFDPTTSTDWRETLRRAGAMKPTGGEPTPGASPGRPRPEDAAPLPFADDVLAATPVPLPAWLEALGIPVGLAAGQASTRVIEPAIASLPTIEAIAEATRSCTRCDLYRTATHAVPGEGDPRAEFLCVGEAPGQNEDEQGRPFIGAAGQLLNKILGAIGLKREETFICNVLKHRPPGNRDPLPDEVRACEPYLRRQLELVQPRVILALGRFAAQSLLQTTTPIGKLRGQVHRYHGIPLIVTYHPAALLRNEAWKRPTWEDVKLARRILDASRDANAPRGSSGSAGAAGL